MFHSVAGGGKIWRGVGAVAGGAVLGFGLGCVCGIAPGFTPATYKIAVGYAVFAGGYPLANIVVVT